ncbi:MAG: DNA-directed RNA polymerase subunit beta, DNA-directed RNA polymerase subunit beta [Candidatus Peregrinibacteria bacterium GW2011_GWF2_33_10]|nr:MAG: DNA-directed RNA polymerase subunit beta, DNA-directed RNA polymerase subunit beta [Candidatus Peregrinibacteria bacterium GW2011_GWF2_33_10]OGJ45891.1 MAG: DNA-directed RNA polymerase subunit beta [Candidatus Peregrinibacteria bacterium RIFOXYA2_FULL_33_21]OGJ46635.1 MAG: DNA-directed RNA polymerase subunit beta [Candidatus Peregrinibacteria bacterium RIFOXYA12_FULL_33_12]OGJ51565.1 MAG: DNA-directed RNA polymerase subunit beta [Candidatus Peregrinibacteria bacterium RIFOXYB2_FULL_33_20
MATKTFTKKIVKSVKISKKLENPQKEKTAGAILEFNNNRENYSKEKSVVPIPNLIEVQLNSYQWFLENGIKELLDEVSPITDFSGKKIELHFLEHSFEAPKYDARTALSKNITLEGSLKAKVQLVNKETGEIKEQEVFLGPVPYMTENGTFIINGNKRVVVNQIVRSPGVFFAKNPLFPKYFNAKIIPTRGCWLEIETDKRGVISIKIDRKRKMPVSSLLRVFGYERDEQILGLFKDLLVNAEENFILKTLQKDSAKTADEALIAVHRRVRPGDLANPENARALIESMFFDFKKYDLGKVARYKINKRLNLDTPNTKEYHTFQVQDFVAVLREIIKLNIEGGVSDDIDHLSNRRVRAVGELMQLKFRVGLARTVRIVQDRTTLMDLSQVIPNQLINCRPITAALKEFFSNSQMSQFMDETNPLAALSHKRRLSAMGPGGLSRERASFEVRDVHPTHYGRICPIETPEGPNIGLVTHLSTYAKINEYGFIQTPYRKVRNTVKNDPKETIGRTIDETIQLPGEKKPLIESGQIISEKDAKKLASLKNKKEIIVRSYLTNEFDYFDADEEKSLVIAQAGSEVNEKLEFVKNLIPARVNLEPVSVPYAKVTNIDASPIQVISISTSLIKFAHHTEAVRATMGTNMARQAVSLVSPIAPIIGTGMEAAVARSSGQMIYAEEDGQILDFDAESITVIYDSGRKVTYYLDIYERSNQATCIHQRVSRLLQPGIKFKKNAVLSDGPSIDGGELALGTNLLAAYLLWEGYNFEDAIILSARLVKCGVFDSIHIERYIVDVRDTKLGPEIVTKDIPNVSENRLKELTEDGVIRIGATIHPGDILVGKITPKGETELSAEERLLRAIFGDKARDVKDTSLRLPSGTMGKVVRIQSFDRKDGDELPPGVIKQIQISVAQRRQISIGDKLAGRYGNKGVVAAVVAEEDMPYLPDGTPVDVILNPLGVTSRMNVGQILEVHLGWAASKLGIKVATPAINGISSQEVKDLLKKAGLPEDGKITLYDGRTGIPFDHKIAIGYTEIMKLNHLVEDKIHARSVGPYSLVTQQPLGGKAQAGGQRFGEMEVWALEAYGAAHILQEILTIKSDDVLGRTNAYEAIIKGDQIKAPDVPESFNVLIKELQSLGLNVELLNLSKDEKELLKENNIDAEISVDDVQEADVPKEDQEYDLDKNFDEVEHEKVEEEKPEFGEEPDAAVTTEEEEEKEESVIKDLGQEIEIPEVPSDEELDQLKELEELGELNEDHDSSEVESLDDIQSVEEAEDEKSKEAEE